MPMHRYSQDCGTESMLRIVPGVASLLQQSNVPGAGIDKFKPFKKVLKDGFLLVDCVKDYMYYRGDKFGDNKHDYKLGGVSDVSIVHYNAFVAVTAPPTTNPWKATAPSATPSARATRHRCA